MSEIAHHPVIVYDYTATRARAGPAKFLEGYRGYLQADAYCGYDAFFKYPARGLIEVGCWAHARRYFFKALESDEPRMGPALLLIAQLYGVEERSAVAVAGGKAATAPAESRPDSGKLRNYLLEIQAEVLPKSPEGRAVRYALNNWTALTRFCEDGDLEIDNGATERAIRGIAVGRGNWTFFGSDSGGKTAAVLRSFIASCKRSESSRSPGSKTCSPASRPIPSPGSPNCFRTTGRHLTHNPAGSQHNRRPAPSFGDFQALTAERLVHDTGHGGRADQRSAHPAARVRDRGVGERREIGIGGIERPAAHGAGGQDGHRNRYYDRVVLRGGSVNEDGGIVVA